MNTSDIAFVACYFNPLNYLSKYLNFLLFYDKIQTHPGVKIIFVESYTRKCKLRINKNVGDVMSFKNESFFWKKENLLNIGITKLMKEYKYVGWLDSDIIFQDDNWIQKIKNELRTHDIVQVANTINKEKSNGKTICVKSMTSYYKHGIVDIKNTLNRIGEPGYGYVYNKDILNIKTPLYDKCICGGGDYLNLLGYTRSDDFIDKIKNNQERIFGSNKNMQINYIEWYNENNKTKTIGCADNTILVKYHGTQVNRKYYTRDIIPDKLGFIPEKDTSYSKSGELLLNRADISCAIRKYFESRNEDDFLLNSRNHEQFKNKYKSLITKYSKTKNKELPFEYLTKVNMQVFKKETPNISGHHFVCVKLKSDVKFSEFYKENATIINELDNANKLTYEQYYIRFIINNYDNIKSNFFFVNDKMSHENFENKKDMISQFNKDIVLRHDLHIKEDNKHITRSNLNFKQWIALFVKTKTIKYQLVNNDVKLIDRHLHKYISYSDSSNYYISGESILKNSKDYYTKIYNFLEKRNNQENLMYLKISFKLLFK